MFRFAAIAVALAVSAYGVMTANSASGLPKQREFVIQNDDGYGTGECLSKASACGKIVADSWCVARGFKKAASFRPAEAGDFTASTGRSQNTEAFLISCAD